MALTGATGFVGRSLVRRLAERGDAPIVLRRASLAEARGADGKGVEAIIVPEPWTREALEAALARARPDALVHLAGGMRSDVAALYRDNVVVGETVMAAMERAAPLARTLVVGSAAEYGHPARDGVCREDDEAQPVSAYGIAKLAQTRHAMLRAGREQDVTVARLFNPVGPGMGEGLAFGDFARRLGLRPDRLRVGDIDSARDFLDVEEAARILVELLVHPKARGRIVNVCSGVATPLRPHVERQLARAARRRGREIGLEQDPALLRPSDVPSLSGSTERLQTLGIAPASASIDAALDALFDAHAAREEAA